MNVKKLRLLILISSMATSQYLFAHGVGGSGSSYEFDKKDLTADREVKSKALEKKQDQDTWADFMNVVNKPDKDKESEHSQDHHAGESRK